MRPAAQQPREHVSAGVAAGPGARSQVRDVCAAHQAPPDERRFDLELASLVLDGLGARCTDRPSLAALSRVLGDDASAAPASSPASRGAFEQLQRQPHCAGIGGGSRGWLRTGHGPEQYHGPINHDTVTVRCDRMGIELSRVGQEKYYRPGNTLEYEGGGGGGGSRTTIMVMGGRTSPTEPPSNTKAIGRNLCGTTKGPCITLTAAFDIEEGSPMASRSMTPHHRPVMIHRRPAPEQSVQ